jgi:low-affinity inorganic phosphate transporter
LGAFHCVPRMELFEALAALTTSQTVLLFVALVIAIGFECINGFHDTVNAVATVISTKSLNPTPAVVWSGMWHFIGVHAGGIGVAFSIVHLLSVDLLVNIKTGKGLAMVLSLLLAVMAGKGLARIGGRASSLRAAHQLGNRC